MVSLSSSSENGLMSVSLIWRPGVGFEFPNGLSAEPPGDTDRRLQWVRQQSLTRVRHGAVKVFLMTW